MAALQAQIKAMEGRIATLTVAEKKEGFLSEPHWTLRVPALVVIVDFLY